ncbi:DgyrCDS11974 [Dimorphilus gyrociliatus]|uniref:DgyrCDS11974 n=1 Tax=Dimorphilus gyrociliatus TaxID=2664684 RepID=A0A7I8W579_9ANNE|nr:DgyrCDS11974 [Dimorphilus gyrociliatus]
MTSMAVGDMTVGIITLPTAFIAENLVVNFTYKTCLINYGATIACPLISVLHFIIIAAEKFITIQYPLRYQQIVTKKAAIISCFIVWLISLLVGFLPPIILIIINKPSYEWFNYCSPLFIFPDGYMFSSVIVFLIPTMITVSVLYAKIIYIARKQSNKVSAEQTKQASQSQRARIIRGMAIILFVLLYFLASWLPLGVLLLIPNLDISQEVWGIIKMIAFSKAWIDPIVFGIGSKEIRNAVMRLICGRKVADDY